jgi:hypothetical protein
MNNDLNYGLPKYRRAIEAGLLAVGLGLFIVLVMQGIQNISDAKAIAGEHERVAASAGTDYEYVLPFNSQQSGLASTLISFVIHAKPKSPQAESPASHKGESDNKKNQNADKPDDNAEDASPKVHKTPAALQARESFLFVLI